MTPYISILMIPQYLFPIFRIVLVLLIILGMIVVLLAINHLTHNDDRHSESSTNQLKHEINKDEKVITSNSVFHKFLARDFSRRIKQRN